MSKKPKLPCSECGKGTIRLHPILQISLCAQCQRENQDKYQYITKTRAIGEYRLKQKELANLEAYEVDNPHFKKAAPMQLYMHSQIKELAKEKWGGFEPYTVEGINFSDDLLKWFLEDTNRLKQLSPGDFQNLIADRLDSMGLEVQLVGNVYRKDGGIDIIGFFRKMRTLN